MLTVETMYELRTFRLSLLSSFMAEVFFLSECVNDGGCGSEEDQSRTDSRDGLDGVPPGGPEPPFDDMLPGRELTEHMENEYALVDDLFLCRTIYRNALEKLAEEL